MKSGPRPDVKGLDQMSNPWPAKVTLSTSSARLWPWKKNFFYLADDYLASWIMTSIGLAWPISAELFQTCTVSWRVGWWLHNVEPMSSYVGQSSSCWSG